MPEDSQKYDKYKYNKNLFRAEPPEREDTIRSLFCGRDEGLMRGKYTLENNIDLKGARFSDGEKRPWIIHGESRSGKSHLARRILIEFPADARHHQFMLPTRERLKARRVMANLFDDAKRFFQAKIFDETTDLFQDPLIQNVNRIVQQVSQFKSEHVTSLTVKQKSTQQSKITLGGKLGIPKVIEFSAGMEKGDGEESEATLTLTHPDATDYAIYTSIIIDTLVRFELIDHVFVLFDDVDLLESYESPSKNGRQERAELSQAIHTLQDTPGVDVLITARSWYGYAKKEFSTLVELSAMTDEALMAIYHKRFQYYAEELPKEFLTPEALSWLAGNVDGKPGVFLQHLDTAFYQFQSDSDWTPRNQSWFLDVVKDLIRRHSSNSAALTLLNEAVRDGRQEINVTEKNSFFNTAFQDELVYPSYYGENAYYISPIAREAIRQIYGHPDGTGTLS